MLKCGIGEINAVVIFPADQNICKFALAVKKTSHQDLSSTEFYYVQQLSWTGLIFIVLNN